MLRVLKIGRSRSPPVTAHTLNVSLVVSKSANTTCSARTPLNQQFRKTVAFEWSGVKPLTWLAPPSRKNWQALNGTLVFQNQTACIYTHPAAAEDYKEQATSVKCGQQVRIIFRFVNATCSFGSLQLDGCVHRAGVREQPTGCDVAVGLWMRVQVDCSNRLWGLGTRGVA